MRLGVSYNIFDGEELLEGSIKQIRSEVDYISVVYQTVSNFGNPCNTDLVPLLERLKSEGLIDELFEYNPKINKGGHFNEIQKRRLEIWESYNTALNPVLKSKGVKFPFIPEYATNNAHMFYLVFLDLESRTNLIHYLKSQNILILFVATLRNRTELCWLMRPMEYLTPRPQW